jgi:prolyl-tRNA synthetase
MNTLTRKAFDLLLDDRDLRPGVKFKDADLIGVPLQVVIGEKNLKNNQIEIKIRKTGEIKKIALDNAAADIVDAYSGI